MVMTPMLVIGRPLKLVCLSCGAQLEAIGGWTGMTADAHPLVDVSHVLRCHTSGLGGFVLGMWACTYPHVG